MTQQARKLEHTLREFEKENIDLYYLLKQNNTEILHIKELSQNSFNESKELKLNLEKAEQQNISLQTVIEDQKLLIGQQSLEIAQLKITNKAYDLSNKENMKNINAAFQKVDYMSKERQKVSNELNNIILRKRKKTLRVSNSFQMLNEVRSN